MGARNRLDHERCQAVFDALGYGILVLTPQGRIEQANRAAAALLGKPPEQLAGRTPHEVMPGLPPPSDACPFQRLRKSLHSESARLQLAERWYNVTADPILDRQGKFTGAVVTLADTTQQKLLDEQLQRSRKMEAIGRLAGVLAHDFSNLLTMISGYGQMLLDGMAPGDPRRSDLRALLEAAGRATTLTRQLLAIGHRQPARPRRLDVNRLVSRMTRVLRRLLGPRIRLAVRPSRPLGRVLADPAQLEQVLMNLVVNARDAMPKGGQLTIATSQTCWRKAEPSAPADLRPGKYVLLSVQDTGTGMDAEMQRHLFEPFFSTKGRRRGIGLGLSIVYAIVKQSHGDIEVDSEPGQGTTFRIYFPVAPQAVARAGR